jgi:hypothetical protein
MNAKREAGAFLKNWLQEHKQFNVPSRPGRVTQPVTGTTVQVNPEESKRAVASMIETRKSAMSISEAKTIYDRAIGTFEKSHIHTDPSQLVAMADVNTIVSLPAARQTRKFPRYIEHLYSAMDRPLAALYGAVLDCVYQFGRIPDALFVNGFTLAAIAEDTRLLTGCKFDGLFRIYYPGAIDGKIKIFQIFTEEQLPFFILNHYSGIIPADVVIAICEE